MNTRILIPLAVAMTMIAAGCSKPEEPTVHEPRPPSATVPLVESPAAGPAAETASTPVPASSGGPFVEPSAEILEAHYLEARRIAEKLPLLDAISDAEAIPAVQSLGRLYEIESDIQLKEEILNALMYVDGADEDKLALLVAAAQPGQPKAVRHTAINLMIEEGNPQAIGALQSLVGDADIEIREDAVFAIEELQAGD